MSELIFNKYHAITAIKQVNENGLDWLYGSYPGPKGGVSKARSGFLMHGGNEYPVKALGRLANTIAGSEMAWNPHTDTFHKYFTNLGFQVIRSLIDEAEEADERQKRLIEVWDRPEQATFRRDVFEALGAKCVVTGCETLAALEAAHIVPVSGKGSDDAWNGIPLRADIHRLFDAGLITISINPKGVRVEVDKTATEYAGFVGVKANEAMTKSRDADRRAEALRFRNSIQ